MELQLRHFLKRIWYVHMFCLQNCQQSTETSRNQFCIPWKMCTKVQYDETYSLPKYLFAVVETASETDKLFFWNMNNIYEKQLFLHIISPNLVIFKGSYSTTEKQKKNMGTGKERLVPLSSLNKILSWIMSFIKFNLQNTAIKY